MTDRPWWEPSSREINRAMRRKRSGTQYQLDQFADHEEERRRDRDQRAQEAREKGLTASQRQAERIARPAPPAVEEEPETDPETMTTSQKQAAVLFGKADSVRTAAIRRQRERFLDNTGGAA